MVASSVNTERLFGVRPQHTLWIWIGLDVTMLGLQAVGGGLAGTYDGDPVSVPLASASQPSNVKAIQRGHFTESPSVRLDDHAFRHMSSTRRYGRVLRDVCDVLPSTSSQSCPYRSWDQSSSEQSHRPLCLGYRRG